MSPKQRYNLNVILRFTVFWSIFGIIYSVVEYGLLGDSPVYPSTNNYYNGPTQFIYTVSGAAILGLIVSLLELFVFNGLFAQKAFATKILFKSTVYLLLIILFLTILGILFASQMMGLPYFHPDVLKSAGQFIGSFAFFSVAIYIGFAFIFSFFVFEMSKTLGLMVFYNFITGKYHKPIIEARIFMFMDMKSSTAIAEQLGHLKYYELLNKYYSDMTDAIINSEGEIYQYVGDEVIISWPLEKGLQDNNCIKCFFEIKKSIESRATEYKKTFDLVPEFKAAIHSGQVTTGEIGQLKKEIVFTGDVLNTTSRVQELCNVYDAPLIITEKVYKALSKPVIAQPLEHANLRGKNNKIGLFKIIGTDLLK